MTNTAVDALAAARDLLSTWSVSDAASESLRTQYLAWIAAHADAPANALSRDCAPHHLTASAIVMSADASEVALTLHPKFGRWLQTGGHIETSDTDLAGAALREAREESGIEALQIDPLPVTLSRHQARCWPGGDHLDVQFVARAPFGAALTCSDESEAVAWFSVDALPPDTDDSVRALVSAARLRLRESPSPWLDGDIAPPTP